ncbi:hypothetical protein [uncultured Algibacter sp.]|uniref:hypothetical protein n=1 Tax=uncultured Algibacter sp. TaxID=298659 RepID=UPI0032180A70
MKFLIIIFLIISSLNIASQNANQIILSKCSDCKGDFSYFDSCEAINKIIDIENHYLTNFNSGFSKYYGTSWRQNSEHIILDNGITKYKSYLNEVKQYKIVPDSLHCTIYAYKALKAGLNDNQLNKLEKTHKAIWKSREIAGWSIGYILVKYFKWKAYLIINSNSAEYNHCLKSYNKNKSYPVWKQPNIPLEAFFIIGQHDTEINNLLLKNEFGWGFSEQGIHTWITRYNRLKECNWLGAPSKKYQESVNDKPLFITTKFSDYNDYNSHVVVFPPSF